MSNLFVLLYKLFESRKTLFYVFLAVLIIFLAFCSSRLVLKEDLAAFIPKDPKLKKYQEVIKNLKANDRIIVNVSLKDTSLNDPDKLTEYAEAFAEKLQSRFDSTWLKEIRYKIEEETAADVFNLLYNDLPYYLNKEDYAKIQAQLSDTAIARKLRSNYETIRSPEGTVLKNYLIQDPLGFNTYALSKLSGLQMEENFTLYNGYFLTKNRKNIFIYLSINYPSTESNKNTELVKGLNEVINELSSSQAFKDIKVEYLGSPVISVSNVLQIRKDSLLTTIVALVVIFAGLFLYFKNLKTILLIFLPVIFGAGFSLTISYLVQGEISAIAIGAGSIVLGIAINYSLHFFTHLKHERSVIKVISDLTLPLTLGCVTTVGAFLCLYFMQSEALHDMGLFAALSLLGAAFCCLVILPHLSRSYEKNTGELKSSLLDKLTSYPFHQNKILIALVVALTFLFAFSYDKVAFETDMIKLSYISPELEQAENNLDKLTGYKLKSVFLVSQGKDLEEALKFNASAKEKIEMLSRETVIKKYTNLGDFLLTDAQRSEKLQQWRAFWTTEKIEALQKQLYTHGAEYHFKEAAFNPLLGLLRKEFDVKDKSSETALKNLFLKEYIQEDKNGASILTVFKVDEQNKPLIYEAFEDSDHLFILDKGSVATMFASVLNQDFNLILILCSSLVFGFLLLSYGRIEMALLAFLPMLVSWIWILGIMALTGIKFNIVNIIICTFMFGLGDDFSIFTLDGLEQEYKYGKNVLASYRNSIILSAFTVIVGIGVLIFAKHPALHSIALVTIIGITCIVFVSMVVQPLIYDLLILGRVKRRQLPITIHSLVLALTLILYFLAGMLWLRFLGLFARTSAQRQANSFIDSLCAFILFTEQKCGEALAKKFVTRYIRTLPFQTAHSLETAYHTKRAKVEDTHYFRGRLIKNYIYKGPVVEWYTRIKTGLEDNYKTFNDIVPKKGKIVDVGCGYGYLSYMLSLTAPEREVTGIDYDEEKISIAQHGVSRTSKLNFYASDVLAFNYEKSDTFIISDVLHYLTEENQAILIRKCLENLNPGGVLIIRDGNSELEDRHKGTKLTEFFSTKLLRFNKVTVDKLYFTSAEKIMSNVADYPVSIETLDNTQFTSNIIFIIRENKS
ncbi:MAG TPA: MMPL family transporter [Cytophagaceae bacterium]|nr:MMPL family transporter [Cytophagaceae bacterium]